MQARVRTVQAVARACRNLHGRALAGRMFTSPNVKSRNVFRHAIRLARPLLLIRSGLDQPYRDPMISELILVSALSLTSLTAPPPDTLAPAALFAPTSFSVALTTLSPSVAAPGRTQEEQEIRQEQEVVEYSDAYFTRLTIHRWASYLTVPLFVGQYITGQRLINGPGGDRTRGFHSLFATGIAGLFAVNTVTGGLNAIEARKDPEEKNRRTLHSVLMLIADAGFVATGMLAGENENEDGGFRGSNNNLHRNVALASMGTALVSCAIMLPIFRKD